MVSLFPDTPRLRFVYEQDSCPLCGGALKVLKTHCRKVATLHIGHFDAHETIMSCDRCPDKPSFRSRELAELVPEGCNFGYDVMVFAGRSLFQGLHTVAETAFELAKRNVQVSESEIRELAARFVISLGIAHAEAAPRLRKHLGTNGGYILHLDSTCQKGSAHLMTGIDELSGMVLLNAKMATENGGATAKFLENLTTRFGMPAAVSCDMSSAILNAVESILIGVPIFICHFHFLRDLGKDLMADDYAVIRERLSHHGPKAELKRLRRELRDRTEAHSKELDCLLGHIENGTAPPPGLIASLPGDAVLGAFVTSALEAEKQGDGCSFPFDRPHLAFYRQIQAVLPAAATLRDCERFDAHTQRLYERAIKAMSPVCADRKLTAAADRIECKAKVFDNLRIAMRIAEPQAHKGLNDDGHDLDIHTIESRVNDFRHTLLADQQLMAQPGYSAMLEQLDKYWDRLFCDPIVLNTPTGERLVQPQRTNNILERFFRRLNRACRKRTGHQLTAKVLNKMLPDVPLIANLENTPYCRILLDGCETLEQRFARIDRKLVSSSLEHARKTGSGLSRKTRAALRRRPAPIQIALHILKNTA